MIETPENQKLQSVAIVGVGLIGGSIGKALLARGLVDQVVGIGRNPDRLLAAIQHEAVTRVTTDLDDGVQDADVVIVCTPVNAIADFVARVAKSCPKSALITDGGSTKARIVQDVERLLAPSENTFVGSHPLAGGEKTGVEAASATLFEERTVVVTPTETTNSNLVVRCCSFWMSIGANIEQCSPNEHDAAVSSISHLPHVVAAILAGETPNEHLSLASSGWCDTTRVAAGDVEMWRQILEQNSSEMKESLRSFGKAIRKFETALENGDFETIQRFLEQGKQKRDAVAN